MFPLDTTFQTFPPGTIPVLIWLGFIIWAICKYLDHQDKRKREHEQFLRDHPEYHSSNPYKKGKRNG